MGHRAFIYASLAHGESTISNIGQGQDLQSTRSVLKQLGVQILPTTHPHQWKVYGQGLRGWTASSGPLECGNSGTTIRLMSGFLCGASFSSILDGDASLRVRPMARLQRVLHPFGATLDVGEKGGAPLKVTPPSTSTPVNPSSTPLDIHTHMSSAQMKGATMGASLSTQTPCIIRENELSRDHSERMLAVLGATFTHDRSTSPSFHFIPPTTLPAFNFTVPGDPSSGAFWMVAAALCPHYPLILENISLNPTRLGLVKILQAMGVEIETDIHGHELGEPYGQMRICGSTLKGVDIPKEWALDALDELPLVALLGSVAHGQTRVRGAEELKVKESDRIEAMTSNLKILGAQIQGTPDGWIIQGQPHLNGGKVRSFHDHRIALCMQLAQRKALDQVEIDHLECSAISYPEFHSLFEKWLTYIDQANL